MVMPTSSVPLSATFCRRLCLDYTWPWGGLECAESGKVMGGAPSGLVGEAPSLLDSFFFNLSQPFEEAPTLPVGTPPLCSVRKLKELIGSPE